MTVWSLCLKAPYCVPHSKPRIARSALGLLSVPRLEALLAPGSDLHLQVLGDLLSLGCKAQAGQNTQQEGGEPHGKGLQPRGAG